ncbi:MAG TPA: nucleotidyltransferase family protein [Actinomycetota bacterium]|nr:nucleotidyltransferase family protein [Actinomycetota bacterium]
MATSPRAGAFITGIVLAAGGSSRLGRPKQLLDLAGKPVLQHVLETLQAAGVDEIVVVLGHRADEIAASIPEGVRVRLAINPDHALGQSTSFRAGLRDASDRSQGAVILLGDQPGVRVDAVVAVIEAWRGGSAVAVQAAYRGVPGHPVLFDRSLWPELERAEGDEGARGMLAANPGWRTLVEVGGSPPLDIDTEDDYARVRAQFEGL